MDGVIRNSVITCPHCGFAQREEMPVDACQFFYDCPQCGARLRPKEGDCCVFSSFGSVRRAAARKASDRRDGVAPALLYSTRDRRKRDAGLRGASRSEF
jgi:hypothetical protein